MGYASIEQRWAIIARWKETHSFAATAKGLGLRVELVQRWVRRYQATGQVDEAPKPGRKPALTAAAARQAYNLLVNVGAGGAKSVAHELHRSGHTSKQVDRRTVIRAVRKLGAKRGEQIVALQGKPGNRLSDATRQKRLAFSRANLGRGWSNVLFTDRKKFLFSYPGVKVHAVTWGVKGVRREVQRVNHATVVNAYAGISKYGVTSFHLVAGTSKQQAPYKNMKGTAARNITADEYKDVVKGTLLPKGSMMFSRQGVSSWLLQQDNDPSHRSAQPVVEQWNALHGSSVAILSNWPPSSPDLNPIENFWGHMQAKVDAKGCRSFSEFKAAVISEAKHVPTAYFSKLVGSMPKRLAKCIKLGGDKTGY